jgi:hypothetical protein
MAKHRAPESTTTVQGIEAHTEPTKQVGKFEAPVSPRHDTAADQYKGTDQAYSNFLSAFES